MTMDIYLTGETLYAPLDEGTSVGYADVYFDGVWVQTVELVTSFPVDRSGWLYFWYTVAQVLFTEATLIVLGLFVIVAGVLWLVALHHRKKHPIRDDADLDSLK